MRHGDPDYTNPIKTIARSKVWSALIETCRGNPNCSTGPESWRALVMPAKGAIDIEIRMLLDAGLRAENIFAVNHNPAIVARARYLHPRINTAGKDVAVAMAKFAADGVRFDLAHLDFCGNLSLSMYRRLSFIARCGALHDGWGSGTAMAITILKGRDDEALACHAADIDVRRRTPDQVRASAIWYWFKPVGNCSNTFPPLSGEYSYKATSPMLVSAAMVRDTGAGLLCRGCGEEVDEYLPLTHSQQYQSFRLARRGDRDCCEFEASYSGLSGLSYRRRAVPLTNDRPRRLVLAPCQCSHDSAHYEWSRRRRMAA
jgi:hypothetical protein